jgi:hypothetical protein
LYVSLLIRFSVISIMPYEVDFKARYIRVLPNLMAPRLPDRYVAGPA